MRKAKIPYVIDHDAPIDAIDRMNTAVAEMQRRVAEMKHRSAALALSAPKGG